MADVPNTADPRSVVDKALAFIQQIVELPDAELAEAFPIAPPAGLRVALSLTADQLPDDPDYLDRLLLSAAGFCLQLRSDDAPGFHVAPGREPGAPGELHELPVAEPGAPAIVDERGIAHDEREPDQEPDDPPDDFARGLPAGPES